MIEFGNVYEVFQLEDRVKVIEPRLIYYGQTGTIVQIEDISYNTEPIYTVRLNKTRIPFDDYNTPIEIKVNAKGLEKIPRRESEEETIDMGLRSGKTYLTQIGSFKNKDNGFDRVIYQMKKERKFMERGTDETKKIDVKKIIFNGPKTIVLWTDGTKTIVSMSKDELRFDPEAAFCAAYTKKMFGSNSKIKRIIEQKSNFEEYTKAAIENAETEFDKFMKCTCPWLYTEEKPTEVEAAIAKAMSEFYKEELASKENKDDEN